MSQTYTGEDPWKILTNIEYSFPGTTARHATLALMCATIYVLNAANRLSYVILTSVTTVGSAF